MRLVIGFIFAFIVALSPAGAQSDEDEDDKRILWLLRSGMASRTTPTADVRVDRANNTRIDRSNNTRIVRE